jgi:hypothetical protein
VDYVGGYEDTRDAFMLYATCTNFPLGTWGINQTDNNDQEKITDDDFDAMSYVLAHDFICKYRSENIILLQNCSTLEFLDALKSLRTRCSSKSSLVIFITTHVFTISKPGKEYKNEDTFMAFGNSVWGSPVDTAETCIPLNQFIAYANQIISKQKTIILNCAHLPKPPSALFKSPKTLYPPGILYSRLALECNCAVVGSCAIGTTLSDYKLLFPGERSIFESADPGAVLKKERNASAAGGRNKESGAFSVDNVYERLMIDWEREISKPRTVAPRPVQPGASWERVNKLSRISILMPSQEEVQHFLYRCEMILLLFYPC